MNFYQLLTEMASDFNRIETDITNLLQRNSSGNNTSDIMANLLELIEDLKIPGLRPDEAARNIYNHNRDIRSMIQRASNDVDENLIWALFKRIVQAANLSLTQQPQAV